MKRIYQKLLLRFKEIFSKKRNIVVVVICLILLITVFLVIKLTNYNKDRFTLNHIYRLYPEEVRKLYANLVEVSCNGDMHFNIKLGSGENKMTDIDKNDLMNYLFSYLEKDDLLNDKMEMSLIKKMTKELFLDNVDLTDKFNNYSYNNYTYYVKKEKITRKKNECVNSDIKYVNHLYGYSYNKNELSIDVNVAYLKDGILYNYSDEPLGEYNGDVSKLMELTKNTSFYRLNYVKRNGIYKLATIEWNSRTQKK